MRTTPSSTFPIGQDYNTEHWSPRVLSVRPTFSHNWLALNPSKSEALLLGTSQRLKMLSTLGSVNISVKTQPISLPALLFLSGWTMQMHVYSASLWRIYLTYREFKTLSKLLVPYVRQMRQISVQLRPSVETIHCMASSFSSHSLQNCPT